MLLINAPVGCGMLHVGVPLAISCATARMDSSGEPACELCGRRLRSVKHHRPYGPGRACAPQCKQKRQLGDSAVAAAPAAAAAPPLTRKRRAQSDPGEPRPRTPSPRRTRPTTIRVAPPMPIAAQKKQRTPRQDDRIMRLLDETHARRMATQKQQ